VRFAGQSARGAYSGAPPALPASGRMCTKDWEMMMPYGNKNTSIHWGFVAVIVIILMLIAGSTWLKQW
jgi:hypothetical protein